MSIKPIFDDEVCYLSYEHTFKFKHDSFIVETVLPQFLKLYYYRQAKKMKYNLHNWNVTVQPNEVKVTFDYTRMDHGKFNEKMVIFPSFIQSQFHSFELTSLFDVLNEIHSTNADKLIFECYQYLENNPDVSMCPFKFTDYKLNSVDQIGLNETLLNKNNLYYQEALDKVKYYLLRFCRAPFYCIKTFMKEDDIEVRNYHVRIMSYFDTIDFHQLEKEGYVKAVLLVPSLETKFIHYSDN
jgi:hypothetical protein